MTSKELTALEALTLLKNLRQNNIDDQEVENILFDIIEETLKKHDFNPEHSYKERQKKEKGQMNIFEIKEELENDN